MTDELKRLWVIYGNLDAADNIISHTCMDAYKLKDQEIIDMMDNLSIQIETVYHKVMDRIEASE